MSVSMGKYYLRFFKVKIYFLWLVKSTVCTKGKPNMVHCFVVTSSRVSTKIQQLLNTLKVNCDKNNAMCASYNNNYMYY